MGATVTKESSVLADECSRCTQGHMKFSHFKSLMKQIMFEYPFLENVNESMLVADCNKPDCPIVYANDNFERMTLYPRESILGVNCRFLQGEHTDPEVVKKIRMAVDSGSPLDVQLLNYRRDGRPFWNIFVMLPIHKSGKTKGKVEYFIAIQKDVSLLTGLSGRVDDWTSSEVSMWLEEVGLAHLSALFLQKGVNGKRLRTLTKKDMRRIGIALVVDRLAIQNAILNEINEDGFYIKGVEFHLKGDLPPSDSETPGFSQTVTEIEEMDQKKSVWGQDLGVNRNGVHIKVMNECGSAVVIVCRDTSSWSGLKQELHHLLGRSFKKLRYKNTADELVSLKSFVNSDPDTWWQGDIPIIYASTPLPFSLKLSGLLSTVDVPVITVDLFQSISQANDSALGLFETDEMIDTDIRKWISLKEGVAVHQMLGEFHVVNISKADDTEEEVTMTVRLYSPGSACITLRPRLDVAL